MIIAGICFNIYEDFGEYIETLDTINNGYAKAEQELITYINSLVGTKQLVFKYSKNKVQILPKDTTFGNIFSKRFGDDSNCWEGITIYCSIDNLEEDNFNSDQLITTKHPDSFVPYGIVY